MAYYPEFSRLLNQELQCRERSASWLAQRLGVSPSTVARWLNHGMRPGTAEMVVQIADILSVAANQQALLVAAGYGYIPATPVESTAEAAMAAGSAAPTVHVRPSRLPAPATPLVGRAAERGQISAWIAESTQRLITIVGPGGTGKTRLSLAVAQEQQALGQFEHGVVFVDLTPLSHADQMPVAIASAIGLPLEIGEQRRSPEQQIIDFLQPRRLLLVLDNAEHLLNGVDLVANIIEAAPAVQILVTSRAPLRLPGEQLYPLQGLDYADGRSEASPTDAPATVLFLQAARRVRPNYHADVAEQRHIAEICRLVEGMPLAIELAASWVTLLSAADILAAIRRSLHFLETDLRGLPARHRSMKAVFDVTWQRLSEEEQQIFARLSVFRGGFTQDAVRDVTDAEMGQLRTLAGSSLIVYTHERNRYSIHELLRQYGALRLAEWPDLEADTQKAHSAFYLDLLRRRQNPLKSRGLPTDLQVLDVETENLSRAWHWAAEHDQVEGIAETLDGMGIYLQWRGRSGEGEAAFGLAAAALERVGETRHLARALAWQALFTRMVGQSEQAAQLLARSRQNLDSLSLCIDDAHSEQAFVLMQMGAIAAARDTETAEIHYRQSLALFEALGEAWYAAEVLLGLGHVCLTQGDFDGQRTCVQKALDTYRALGNVRGTASALSMLADIDSYRGRPLSGLELGFESLAAFRSLGDPLGVATSLSRLGMTYMNLGDVTSARQVVNESAAIFSEVGSRRDQAIAFAFLCAVELMAGDYWQAHANAQRCVAIATQSDDQFVLGVAVGFLGWAQLTVGNLHGALHTLRESVIITKGAGATMDLTRAYALLGMAQWQNGQEKQARAHCYQSLRLSAQVADAWSLLTAIGTSLAILAGGENPVRAVELYSMLRHDSLGAACRWLEDSIGTHVNAAMEQLPHDVVAAALSRGQGLNQREEAAKLVDEVATLGWELQ
ncbi:MAG: AAA family ATPase [Caldilineaceae bacterium]|nr:AAA family ATPase [Caldilineaceae bacterium]